MRFVLLTITIVVPLMLAQTVAGQGATKKGITLERLDFPNESKLGEEFTVKASFKNREGRLAFINARLIIEGEAKLVVPVDEQLAFIEVDADGNLTWRVQRTGGGKISFRIETYLLTDLRGVASPVNDADKVLLEKNWRGLFTEPGNVYEARLKMRVNADGAVEGKILWTLKESKREDYQNKLCATGFEFVRGTFNAKTRELYLEGYRRDDPERILGLDKYTMKVRTDGKLIEGATWNHGRWDSKFELTPVEQRQ